MQTHLKRRSFLFLRYTEITYLYATPNLIIIFNYQSGETAEISLSLFQDHNSGYSEHHL